MENTRWSWPELPAICMTSETVSTGRITPHTGGVLAYGILKDLGMPLEDVLTVTSAIGHHDEATGAPVDEVSAALILADKSDVRRNRVQNPYPAKFDAHDRVNYAVLSRK